MTIEGVVSIDGLEVANSLRTVTYMRAGIKGHSPAGLNPNNVHACGTGPFTTPSVDPAPWYAASIPASVEFAGVLIDPTSCTGFDGTPQGRNVDAAATATRPRVAGRLSSLSQKPRTMVVVAWLFGSTCRGLDYGYEWLAERLDRDPADLRVFKCCDTGSPVPATFRRAAVVDGPNDTTPAGVDRCHIRQVTFTMTAELPYPFGDPATVLDADFPAPSASPTYQAVITGNANLVDNYRMDDASGTTIVDTGTGAHNGTITVGSGTSTRHVTGLINGDADTATQLAGSSGGAVSLAKFASIAFVGSGAFSYLIWFKTSAAVATTILEDYDSGTGVFRFRAYVGADGRLYLTYYDSSGATKSIVGPVVADGQRHMLAVSYEDLTGRTSFFPTPSVWLDSSSLWFGDLNTYPWPGQGANQILQIESPHSTAAVVYDELSIYTEAISTAFVQQAWSIGSQGVTYGRSSETVTLTAPAKAGDLAVRLTLTSVTTADMNVVVAFGPVGAPVPIFTIPLFSAAYTGVIDGTIREPYYYLTADPTVHYSLWSGMSVLGGLMNWMDVPAGQSRDLSVYADAGGLRNAHVKVETFTRGR